MEILSFFNEVKTFIEELTFLSRDGLHIYGGVLFYMSWILVFKHKYHLAPLIIIASLALFNEAVDLNFAYQKRGFFKLNESCKDIFNTIFLPILLYLFLRFRTSFYQKIEKVK